MNSYLVLSIVLAFVAVSQQAAQVKLSVYYESKCPDSRRFIINQLYPVLTQLGGVDNEFLEAEFVPYGKATTTVVDGSYVFDCQHGELECQGNQVHSCALAKLPKNESAALINCMMDSFNPPFDAPDCASELGIDYSKVDECDKSWEGPTLLAANGIKTHDLDPTLYYVPWIMYEDVWTVEDMENSELDLLGVLCDKLSSGVQPSQCQQ